MAKDDDGDVVRPDFKTRFTSETAPRTGRKPGSVNRKKVNEIAERKLDTMFDQASKNIETALKNGCQKTSIWFIEHMKKRDGMRVEAGLLEKLGGALDRIEDVERVSRRAVLLAIDGGMTFEELTAIQSALSRHSNFAGLVEVKALRDELAALRGEVSASPAHGGLDHAPAWGRIMDRTSRPEEEDDEDEELGVSGTEGRAP